jgi:hypothetical protein
MLQAVHGSCQREEPLNASEYWRKHSNHSIHSRLIMTSVSIWPEQRIFFSSTSRANKGTKARKERRLEPV